MKLNCTLIIKKMKIHGQLMDTQKGREQVREKLKTLKWAVFQKEKV
jgi:hypothetical protein